jgi:cation diffusion facilitator CzcD-associated flavoprotein CzcO
MPNRKNDKWWEKIIPLYLQSRFLRIMYLFMGFFLRRMMKDPKKMKDWLNKNTKEQLPPSISLDPHFNPTYAPGTQRICLCPDGDFFQALRSGKAGVATGVIKTMTEKSIILESGETIEADIIITATVSIYLFPIDRHNPLTTQGLHLAYGGNSTFTIDNEPLHWSNKFFWRGAMIQDVPNLMLVQGYSTASWTLGADATAHMACRLLKHLQKNNMSSAVPRVGRPEKMTQSAAPGIMGLTSTYIVEAKKRLPMHGERDPWRARGNYLRDLWFAKWGDLRPGLSFVSCVRE